jgi:hypothetical protein
MIDNPKMKVFCIKKVEIPIFPFMVSIVVISELAMQ